MEFEEGGPEVRAVVGELWQAGEVCGGLRIALPRRRLVELALGGPVRLRPLNLAIQVELRRRELYYFGGDSFKKWLVLLASSVTWAARSGLLWQSVSASSGENGSVMPTKR